MWSGVIMRLISSALWRSKASSSAAAAALTAAMGSASRGACCGFDGGDGLSLAGAGLRQAGSKREDEDEQGCCPQGYTPLRLRLNSALVAEVCRHRRRGDTLAVSANRQQHDVKLGAARLEALKHVSPIASPKGDDAVAEARPVLKLVGKFASRRGVDLQPDIRVEILKFCQFVLARKCCHHVILEGAQHAARREWVSALAALRRWPHSGADI